MWTSCFKFCFERNPFDKAVSRCFWSTEEPRPDVGEFLERAPVKYLSDWPINTRNDHIAVDFVGRHENLASDLEEVRRRIGLPAPQELPQAKGGHRPGRAPYREVLDAAARRRIEIACAKEVVAFGYEF